ncbi:MAG: hypothetical protein ABMA64_16110 [Myxococcota bacterium]
MWWIQVAEATDPSGRWTLATPPVALAQAHSAAVEAGVAQLPWAVRALGRPRIAEAVRNCGVLDLRATDTTLTAVCDADPPVTFTLGRPSTVERDGVSYSARAELRPQGWALAFAGGDGGQTVVYERHPDGTLAVTKAITSSWLPNPVAWTVTYTE